MHYELKNSILCLIFYLIKKKILQVFNSCVHELLLKLQGMLDRCMDAQIQDWTDADHYKIFKALFLHCITAGGFV